MKIEGAGVDSLTARLKIVFAEFSSFASLFCSIWGLKILVAFAA